MVLTDVGSFVCVDVGVDETCVRSLRDLELNSCQEQGIRAIYTGIIAARKRSDKSAFIEPSSLLHLLHNVENASWHECGGRDVVRTLWRL